MATVKIILDPNETPEEAEELLQKALSSHPEGLLHSEEFNQPVAKEVINHMETLHEQMWEQILREVAKVIDKDLANDYL